MSTERFYVCLDVRGSTQYYQRESELPDGKGKFVVKPYFTDRTQAVKLGEEAALFLANRLRKLGQQPWLEKMDGTRVELPWKTETPVAEIPREAVMATLDPGDEANPNARWFVVRSGNTVNGPRWFIRCTPVGLPEQILWDDSPIQCLKRAAAIKTNGGGSMLDWAERAPNPEPKPAAPIYNTTFAYRKRPGELK